MSSIELMGFSFNKQMIEKHKIYAFQLSEELKELFFEILENNPKYFKGRMIFEIGNALQQEEIIHCFGSINVILRNQDTWFFSNEPFEPYFLFDFLKEWLEEECEKADIDLSEIPPIEKWGEFKEISWADLMDEDLFENGTKTLEKIFLSLLEDIPFEFLPEQPLLEFHRVINEGESVIMTKPLFPENGTAFSYTLKGRVKRIEEKDEFIFTYNPSVRLWIEEPVTNNYKYLQRHKTTNAYIYTTGLLGVSEKVVYNQLSLRKNNGVIRCHKLAHEEFVHKIGLNLPELLKEELTEFKKDKTQLLVTLPNECRTGGQRISRRKGETANSTYGLGLSEREKINVFVKRVIGTNLLAVMDILPEAGLKGLRMEKKLKFERHQKLSEYGISEYSSSEKKLDLNKEELVRFDSKKTIKLGLFSANKVVIDALIGTFNMIMRADKRLGEYVYENKFGVQIHIDVIDENIVSEIESSSDINERTQLIKTLVEGKGYDGVFIEIGDLRKSESDPKKYIEAIFAELGIKTQFIHPTNIKGDDILNRAIASSKDLLTKMGWYLPKLVKYFNDEKKRLGVSVLEYRDKKIPVILKANSTGVSYKMYPEERWTEIGDSGIRLNQKYILGNEKDWDGKNNLKFPVYANWINKQLSKEVKEDLVVIWDLRTNNVLPNYTSNREMFLEIMSDIYETGSIVTYQYANPGFGYLAWDKNGNLGKLKGIFKSSLEEDKWYLIGSRVPNKSKNDETKIANPKKLLIMSSLCEAKIYTGKEDNNYKELIPEIQFLRLSSLSMEQEVAYPFPLSHVPFLEQTISSMIKRYSLEERKRDQEEREEAEIGLSF